MRNKKQRINEGVFPERFQNLIEEDTSVFKYVEPTNIIKSKDPQGTNLMKAEKTTHFTVELKTGMILGVGKVWNKNDYKNDNGEPQIFIKRTDHYLSLIGMSPSTFEEPIWYLKYAKFTAWSQGYCRSASTTTDNNDEQQWMEHHNIYYIHNAHNYRESSGLLIRGLYPGNVYVPEEECESSNINTTVINGIHSVHRAASVKRIAKVKEYYSKNDLQIIHERWRLPHKHVVELFDIGQDQYFIYIVFRRCVCSLQELIWPDSSSDATKEIIRTFEYTDKFVYKKKKEYPSPELLKLLRDMDKAVDELHGNRVTHGSLTPHNVVIYKTDRVPEGYKEDSYLIAKIILGLDTKGTVENSLDAKKAEDMFDLGCLFLYSFSGCGSGTYTTLRNNLRYSLRNNHRSSMHNLFEKHLLNAEDVSDLIQSLLLPDKSGHHHPRLWKAKKRLKFYNEISDFLQTIRNTEQYNAIIGLREVFDRRLTSYNRNRDTTFQRIINTKTVNWRDIFDERIVGDLETKEKAKILERGGTITSDKIYKSGKVYSLLRCIRNTESHFLEFEEVNQERLGKEIVPRENYYSSRFPKLLMEVYKVTKRYPDTGIFKKYSTREYDE